MGQKFSDNARSLLTASISAGATSLTIESSRADRFPVANTTDWLAPGNWFKAVLIAPDGSREVVHVGARTSGSGVLANLRRGREGTTALALAAGSVVMLAITAADIEAALAGDFVDITAQTLEVGGLMRQNGIEGRLTPVGAIMMWSGSIASIPAGWRLCDGTNGTPDLRDRFIIGARVDSSGQALTQVTGLGSKVGGSKDAQLVSHSHSFNVNTSSNGEHSHSIYDPGHSHDLGQIPVNTNILGTSGYYDRAQGGGYNGYRTGASGTGIGVNTAGAHVHNVAGTTTTAGDTGVNRNLPPYYALAFIQCVAI